MTDTPTPQTTPHDRDLSDDELAGLEAMIDARPQSLAEPEPHRDAENDD